MTGTSAILFFHIDEEESANDAKSRLFKLIDLIPKVPGVALMILTTSNDFVLEEALEGVYSHDIVQVSHWSCGAQKLLLLFPGSTSNITIRMKILLIKVVIYDSMVTKVFPKEGFFQFSLIFF